MTNEELDDWFCALSTKQKDHIAAKVAIQQGKDPKEALYPNAVTYWVSLDMTTKQYVHDHCEEHHGMTIQEGGDTPIYSY